MNKYTITVLLFAVFSGNSLYAGKLDDISETVRTEKEDKDKPEKEDKDEKDSKGEDIKIGFSDLEDAVDFFYVMGVILTSPFWVPHGAFDRDDISEFSRYPYKGSNPGYMKREKQPDGLNDFSLRFFAEGGYDFEGVSSLTGSVFLDTESRFGFELSSTYMREWIDESTYDSLSMSEFNVVYRFVQNPAIQMRTGIGVRFMNDYIGTETGSNFTYGLDIYPLKPWIISASVDFGTLGEASVQTARFTVGAIYKKFEWYGGYNSLRIDTVQIHGPVAGVRYWM